MNSEIINGIYDARDTRELTARIMELDVAIDTGLSFCFTDWADINLAILEKRTRLNRRDMQGQLRH